MTMRRHVIAILAFLGTVLLWLAAAHGQSPELIDAMRRAGDLYSQGRYAEAATVAEEAVRMLEREFGPNHPSGQLC
jgi:hypothetical protein